MDHVEDFCEADEKVSLVTSLVVPYADVVYE